MDFLMTKNMQVLLIYISLAGTTWLAFQQVGNNEFIDFDDNVYIMQNHHIHKGITIQGLRWAFTTGYAANWHPVTWISHMVDVQLFRLKPKWHHLTNLLFHIANVLLLFFVLSRMTKAPWKSAMVAALFALHPLHVESVAWAAERKDVLSTFFWMLTLIAYGYYVRNPRLKNYMVVLAFFALGLMSKPMVVTLPFVLLLFDYWPLERFGGSSGGLNQLPGESVEAMRTEAGSPVSTRKEKGKTGNRAQEQTVQRGTLLEQKFKWASIRPPVLEKVPLLVLSVLSCVATYIAQNKGGAVSSIEIITPGIRISNAFVSYLLYITKTVWPHGLSIFYSHPGLRPLWQVFGAMLFLVAVTFAVIRTGKRFPYLPVGWLWFTGTLVPVIGIVQVGGQAMADRYAYIPSIGIFIMAAWGIPEIFKKRRYGKELLAGLSALCLACFFILTWVQVGYWRDYFTLFYHAATITKDDFTLYNNRGIAYKGMGDNVHAIEDFNKAIEINPRYAQAYSNRGTSFVELGKPAQAVEDYNKAIELDSHLAGAFFNRGVFYQSSGNFRQAIADYDRAVENSYPNLEEALCNRGAAYGELGNQSKAIENYDMAIASDPEYVKAYFNRGLAYGQLGKYLQAINDFDKCISLDNNNPEAYFGRGMTYGNIGKENQAIEDIKTAARLGSEQARAFLRKQGMNW